MHNHNDKNSGKSKLGMAILCVLPLAIIFLVGPNIFSAGYFWPVAIGAFAILHIWMMARGHGAQEGDVGGDRASEGQKKADISPTEEQSKSHKGSSCCH